MVFGGITDVLLTYDGDLAIKDGDIATTSGFDWFTRELNKIIRTSPGEWLNRPNVGADLEQFAGASNTKETGAKIEAQLSAALNRENIAYPGKLEVRVIPTSLDSVVIYIFLNITGNRVFASKVIFDFVDGIPKPIFDPSSKPPQVAQMLSNIVPNTSGNSEKNRYVARYLRSR